MFEQQLIKMTYLIYEKYCIHSHGNLDAFPERFHNILSPIFFFFKKRKGNGQAHSTSSRVQTHSSD